MVDLKETLKEIDGYCAFEVTLKVRYVIPKGYTRDTPEEIAKEWFDKYKLHVQNVNIHAFRDSSKIGNS